MFDKDETTNGQMGGNGGDIVGIALLTLAQKQKVTINVKEVTCRSCSSKSRNRRT